MGLPRSTYYDAPAVKADDGETVAAMTTICDEFEAYGYRRVAELRHRGMVVNSKKVRRLMRQHDLQPKRRRRFVPRLTVITATRSSLTLPAAGLSMARTSCGSRILPTSLSRRASSIWRQSWMPGRARYWLRDQVGSMGRRPWPTLPRRPCNARRIAILADSKVTQPAKLEALQNSARARGVELVIFTARVPEEITPAMDVAGSQRTLKHRQYGSPYLPWQRRDELSLRTSARLSPLVNCDSRIKGDRYATLLIEDLPS